MRHCKSNFNRWVLTTWPVWHLTWISHRTFARLLRRSPNILLIPGASSVTHLRENLTSATRTLPEDQLALLDRVAA